MGVECWIFLADLNKIQNSGDLLIFIYYYELQPMRKA